MEDEFEWDDAKSDRCFVENGYDFVVAKEVFAGPYVEWDDERMDYGEQRTVAVGLVYDVFLTVVYTERPPRKRLISSWESEDSEIEEYMKFHGV